MWTELLGFVGIPVIRSFTGWIENSFKDGKIDSFEWKLLGSTILRVGIIGLAAYFGLGLDNVSNDLGPVVAGGIAILADFGISALRKVGK
jgi:hypothetical protein